MMPESVETTRQTPLWGDDIVRAAQQCAEPGRNDQVLWRKCRRCGVARPLKSFREQVIGSKSYLKYICKRCDTQLHKEWYKKNPVLQLLQNARARAKKHKVPFNLVAEDIRIPPLCPVLGIAMPLGNRRNHVFAPTVDRLVPELGYVRGNIRIISHRANMLKSNAGLEELEAVVGYLREIKTYELTLPVEVRTYLHKIT